MSLLENRKLLHIGAEIVTLLAFAFYFSKKNTKLLGYIEDLSQRVEEQEDIIQKHEAIIHKLVQRMNTMIMPTRRTPPPLRKTTDKGFVKITKREKASGKTNERVSSTKNSLPQSQSHQLLFQNVSLSPAASPQIVVEEEGGEEGGEEDDDLLLEEEIDDTDLDAEIAAELDELNNEEDIVHDLKKNEKMN